MPILGQHDRRPRRPGDRDLAVDDRDEIGSAVDRKAALRIGDFARYGSEIALVQQALTQLEALTGGAAPSGAPSLGSPAPASAGPASSPSPSPTP